MSDAKAIRRHAAQHDLFNRLHSIASDEQFVRTVAEHWFNSRFQVVANQRCGTWYCDPSTCSDVYAYFKSTDGHTLVSRKNWSFNLRRSNLPLAAWAEANGGFILVDSTRRGKRMPDGLSKTVPIWAACVNRAIAMRRKGESHERWDTNIYLPAIVSPSERSQIEAKLDEWAEDLESSELPLPDLTKPLRPFFVHPATSRPPEIPANAPYTPIICLSASRWVNGSGGHGDILPSATRLGSGFFARTVGFDYVPGAGDDDELWGRGLKPAIYHDHKDRLLSTDKDKLPALVDELVRESDTGRPFRAMEMKAVEAFGLWRSTTKVHATLALDLGHPSHVQAACDAPDTWVTIRVAKSSKSYKGPAVIPLSLNRDYPEIIFAVPCPRAEPKGYGPALRNLETFLTSVSPPGSHVATVLAVASQKQLESAAATWNDALLSEEQPVHSQQHGPMSPAEMLDPDDLQEARKVVIPIAVVLLCRRSAHDINKMTISSHLHRLVALWPDGNPPRAALKRINEYLMSEGRAQT